MKRDSTGTSLLYTDVGVDTTRVGVDAASQGSVLAGLVRSVTQTFSIRGTGAEPLLPLGYFANVLDLGNGLGLAISTDGVGTKILIAQMMDKYDTIGIDCVAMNVNDVVCVGAEPIAMTDYIATQTAERELLTELGKGLLRGAQLAGISIPGGEVAQVAEMIHGFRQGRAFDLVGTCVGVIPTDRILVGQDIRDGDVVIGLASSGIHSNGLTLARHVLLDQAKLQVTDYVAEFGCSVGEELLKPTTIYVPFALACLRMGLPIKAFIHVTSDGFLNLTRVDSRVGYVIEDLLEVPPIFELIQRAGDVADEEMFRVFNMGTGFCVVASPEATGSILTIAAEAGCPAKVIGQAVADTERTVRITPRRLAGQGDIFHKY